MSLAVELANPFEDEDFILSLNCKLKTYHVGNFKAGSIEINFEPGVVGTFCLGASNSGIEPFKTVYNSQMSADDDGLMWNLTNINYKFVRVEYTGASTNVGTMYARFRKETDHL